MPLGVPRPVGPSQPVPALQSGAPQRPLLPVVTSFRLEVCEYKLPGLFVLVLPASAKTEAVIGVATYVPPNTSHPDWPYESYTATPVLGLATADESACARFEQPVLTPLWKLGFE